MEEDDWRRPGIAPIQIMEAHAGGMRDEAVDVRLQASSPGGVVLVAKHSTGDGPAPDCAVKSNLWSALRCYRTSVVDFLIELFGDMFGDLFADAIGGFFRRVGRFFGFGRR